jgi:hypothetical protein
LGIERVAAEMGSWVNAEALLRRAETILLSVPTSFDAGKPRLFRRPRYCWRGTSDRLLPTLWYGWLARVKFSFLGRRTSQTYWTCWDDGFDSRSQTGQ